MGIDVVVVVEAIADKKVSFKKMIKEIEQKKKLRSKNPRKIVENLRALALIPY